MLVVTCTFWTNRKAKNEVPLDQFKCTRTFQQEFIYFAPEIDIIVKADCSFVLLPTWSVLTIKLENNKLAGLRMVNWCATNADCRLHTADLHTPDVQTADLQTCRLDKLAHSEICRPKFLWRQRILWVPFFMPSRSQVLLRSPAKMDEGEQISTLWIT